MPPQLSSNRRIAKNTILLYGRMIVVMVVSLYTTRVVLNVLGETNYGIYNIIGGIVVLFSFLNIALTGATQRYLSFALGKNDKELYNRYYSASIISYVLISLIVIILAETIGLWFVNVKLSIPSGRIYAANIVYQLTILTFIINIFKIPFEAAVISHERMSFYAYLSIADVILRLGVVFLLIILSGDKLILYAALMTLIPLGITIYFSIFCHQKLGCKFTRSIEKDLLKDLFSFSGWSLIGGLANVIARQGGNILINIFFGVTVNAAFGIANQVSSAVNSLVGSFQTAFRPQIIKLYAADQKEELNKLIFRTSTWSYYLMLIIVLPISFNLNEILSLWLVEVPSYASIFIICLFIYSMIDALQTPLISNILATANIKVYEIWLSAVLILNIPISYLFFRSGYPPFLFFLVYASLNLISAIIRTIWAHGFIGFPVKKYCHKVIIPIIRTTISSVVCAWCITNLIPTFKFSFIINAVCIFIISLPIILYTGIDKHDRHLILHLIHQNIITRILHKK